MSKTIAIIGGGAAGFFCAVNHARLHPENKVIIFEKSSKLLAKVRVSGGGRCNVTHACFDNNLLVKNYPRGEKQLKSVFSRFTTTDTIEWFESRGVALKTEADGRMFPESDSSESIINCLMQEADRFGVEIRMNTELVSISKKENKNELHFKTTLADKNSEYDLLCDAVVVTSGGFPKKEGYDFLNGTGHTIKEPIPSLFTINLPESPIIKLMGVSVPEAQVKIASTNYFYRGPLLITHWGFSGPAVLKLSAFAAEHLHKSDYNTGILINWISKNEEEIRTELNDYILQNGKSTVFTQSLYPIPKRLWEYILFKAEIQTNKLWNEVSKKQINKLVTTLSNDEYKMQGKTTFKEEFVTCGGIPLNEVDLKTMESKRCSNVFFAGEVLDIDGITGGFNFQNAWSTAWIAANSI